MGAVIPLFRRGEWYTSLDTEPVADLDGTELSLAPEIMLRDDARWWGRVRDTAPAPAPHARREILRTALDLFQHADLDVGGLGRQSPADFAAAMDVVAGLPPELTTRWCELLRGALDTTEPHGTPGTLTLVYLPGNTFTCLDSVCQRIAGGGAVWIRPSRRDPVSAARFVAALLAAGWPAARLGFYPTRTDLFRTLVAVTDEQVVYGGSAMARLAGRQPALTMHGPGRGLAVVPAGTDPDEVAVWLAGLVAADSGRFCRNVRTIACLGDPAGIARACAAVLDGITVPPVDRRWPVAAVPEATALAAAEAVAAGLGPHDVRVTGREPVVRAAGRHWLAPTLLHVRWRPDHPLLGRELPFAFAAVVGVDAERLAALRAESLFIYEYLGKDVVAP
ncbi:hypothetical protein Daura_15860 [Dactylosporangium aurantiacum]|uniref:Aldehyde dehydrogenase domain-containing protein n=1 Tax=Dactylosporangium aurantiacum TaxID=35754 RepID=A0A9Q9IJV8_9ACTN|nr:hypothetical protein [Dactylosporangium aurantiacum]MDG6102980.1 hypothetical protein [Dactylosporangium aurantiacum]UWZ57494.1 hypothetical protein Daura_15860 [Dactylosporangium aurantiacum]